MAEGIVDDKELETSAGAAGTGGDPGTGEPSPGAGDNGGVGKDQIEEGVPPEFVQATGMKTLAEYNAYKVAFNVGVDWRDKNPPKAEPTKDKPEPEPKADPLSGLTHKLQKELKTLRLEMEQRLEGATTKEQRRQIYSDYEDAKSVLIYSKTLMDGAFLNESLVTKKIAELETEIVEGRAQGFFDANPQYKKHEARIRKMVDSGTPLPDVLDFIDEIGGTRGGLKVVDEETAQRQRLRRARMGTEGFVETPNQTGIRAADRQEINKEKAAILADLRNGKVESYRARLAKWNSARS